MLAGDTGQRSMILRAGHRALIAGGPAGDAGLKLPTACLLQRYVRELG